MKTTKFAILCIFASCTIVLGAGCATTPAPVTERVEIPVFTPCVKAAIPLPDFEVPRLAPDASDGEKVLAIARDIPRHLKYELALLAIIQGCL